MATFNTLDGKRKIQFFLAIPLFLLFKYLCTFLTYHIADWANGFIDSWLLYLITPIAFLGLCIILTMGYTILIDSGYNFYTRLLLILICAASMLFPRIYFYNARWPIELFAEILVVLISIRQAWNKQMETIKAIMSEYDKIAEHNPELADSILNQVLNSNINKKESDKEGQS